MDGQSGGDENGGTGLDNEGLVDARTQVQAGGAGRGVGG
ncbi:hypothetical protein D557_2535 [Bordetella holmesii 70147]|nr:hypothetical protein D557_2535 [Bordetella holmesii 70147]